MSYLQFGQTRLINRSSKTTLTSSSSPESPLSSSANENRSLPPAFIPHTAPFTFEPPSLKSRLRMSFKSIRNAHRVRHAMRTQASRICYLYLGQFITFGGFGQVNGRRPALHWGFVISPEPETQIMSLVHVTNEQRSIDDVDDETANWVLDVKEVGPTRRAACINLCLLDMEALEKFTNIIAEVPLPGPNSATQDCVHWTRKAVEAMFRDGLLPPSYIPRNGSGWWDAFFKKGIEYEVKWAGGIGAGPLPVNTFYSIRELANEI